MNISSDILYEGLSELFKTEIFGSVTGRLSLGTALFTDGKKKYEDGCVYLSASASGISMPKKKVPSILIVSGNKMPEAGKRFESALLVKNASIFTVHNAVQEIFKIYDTWNSDLRRILNEGSDVQAMIDASTPILGEPLLLQDSNYVSIAVSSRYAGNPLLDPIIDSNNVPYLMQSERHERESFPGAPSVAPIKLAGRRALYVNLFQQGRFRYRLLMPTLSEHPRVSAPNLLEYLSTYIQLAIGYVVDDAKSSENLPFILEKILSGEYSDPVFVEQTLTGFGWLKSHRYICAKIYADIPDYNNRTLHFMSDRLKSVFHEAGILEYDNSIVILFNLDTALMNPENIESALENYLRDNNLRAGLSDMFTGFEYFREYYIEAGTALEIGARNKPYSWLYHFGDTVRAFILKSCTEKLPARMICDKRLLKLKEYDELHHQDLYHTLYIYLKNNLRSVNAAKELFIHRSTFLYRIERIREITGISSEAEEEFWYLLLSYKLLEDEEAAGGAKNGA
ncbi:MAG: helix-turn-helix domain-containing protein [Clostridiales Family XIII bacterium]|jgi:hypothetical protein|nr:helix-turn-helix domain-containing protein [Clostridiales Family XIII bacterium]